MLMKPGNQRAFTLVELLVVIAIIGILVALLLPAIQSAREAARRTQCANQMKQLALAALNFESSHKRLPGGIGYYAANTPIQPKHWNGLGWLVEILPQMEQQGLADEFARFREFDYVGSVSLKPPGMLDAVQVQPEGFACPSDPAGHQLIDTQFQWEGIMVAPTNYRGVMGTNQMSVATSSFPTVSPDQDYCNDGAVRCNGLIWRTSAQYPIRIRMVTDGMSKTMMVGEDLPTHDYHTMWSFSNGDSSSTYAPLNYSLNHPAPNEWYDMRGFRSWHPGGANFAFGDGRVEFIQEDIDFDVYKEMSTASDVHRVKGGRS
jgi:prepilin-type N-terminal cleavage/methylation domain-containing protein/prepilin-type processing-associated H-X9-DG protein